MDVNGSGSVNITVEKFAGQNPDPNSACGNALWYRDSTTGVLFGGTIRIYEKSSTGNDCLATMLETIAHEIGHGLGLDDVGANCLPDIMGPNNFQAGSRQVLGQDCAAVDSRWTTPSERQPPPPPPSGPDGCYEIDCNGGAWNPEPLVLDLNGDGVNTTDLDDMVWFDLDGNGAKDRITWTNGATMEGFLWVNLTGKNRVDDGSELFGIGTVLPNGSKARDGFQALSVYDDSARGGNGDGVIDASDWVWNRLRVWVDANHNGTCEPTEVHPLHKFGVEGISLAAVSTNVVDGSNNGHYLKGRYWRHVGSQLRYFDIDGLTFQGERH